MSDRISTKAGVFESGEKDVYGVQYKDGRLIACRNPKLKDYAVAEGTEVICDRAFINMKELRSVILPASLRAIGESAFSGCKALADISLPDGVTEIRQATFRDCDSLAAIELPASVTEIEKFAFGRGLTTLVVNAPEMKIDKYAFMNARDLATLIVPAGRAGYYRALLADIRVKAAVEEMPAGKECVPETNTNSENSTNLKNMKEKEFTNQWLRIYPEVDSATAYRIGLPPDEEDSNYLEDTLWELYFAQSGSSCDHTYDVDEEDSYAGGGNEVLKDATLRRIASIISAFDKSNPKGLSDNEIKSIKAIYENPVFDNSVPEVYREWIKSFSKPGMTEEEAVKALFKAIIRKEELENPVGIECDDSEEDELKVGFFIKTDEDGFDPSKVEFITFDCEFEDGPKFLYYCVAGYHDFLNLIIYDGVFYANTDDDDGFWCGCEANSSYCIDGNTLEEEE